MFPSPYGVSSILIRQYLYRECKKENQVSVFLWSIIHSYYFFYFILIVLFCQWVSVSLQSIIHSYFTPNIIVKDKEKILSFRLLTELYSFLRYNITKANA